MTEEEYKIMEDLFMGRWKDKRGNSLMKKCEALYELAKNADGGRIVELGTYHGCGTLALAFGARAGVMSSSMAKVYTIDDFAKKQGWAGEWYGPDDEQVFEENMRKGGVENVTLFKMTVEEAGNKWDQPISLVFWDLGERDRLLGDFLVWGHKVVKGGTFAIREGDQRRKRQLGSENMMKIATERYGWRYGTQYPAGHVYTIVKGI